MEEQKTNIKRWLGTGSINIFGRPFAGKDTQGEILCQLLDAELIAGGDILRSYHDQAKIKQLMSTGDLFPTDFYLSVVLPYLSNNELDGRPLILSSIGRMKGEESTIMEATERSGHPMKAVILLNLSEQEVRERFQATRSLGDRGIREDDNHQALENRLVKFKEQTMPVIEYYKNLGLLIEVNGTKPKDEVTKDIINQLHQLAQTS